MILRRIFVAVLLLLLVDAICWAFSCRQLERGIRETITAARQDGWSIAADGSRWAGWPFAAAIDLNTVVATVPPGLAWHAQTARVELGLLHPTTLVIRIGRSQSVEARGLPTIPLTAARTVIEADLTGKSPPRASIGGLEAALPAGKLALDAATIDFPPNGIAADFAALSLPGVATPIGTIHLRAIIDPAPPLAVTPQAGARAWRQAGGHVGIPEASMHWDELDAAGSATITLDNQLQPKAEGTVQASGLPRLLDDLAKAGALSPAQAGAAKAVIGVLAAPSGGKRVELPISLNDGILRLAHFPLLRFDPIAWD